MILVILLILQHLDLIGQRLIGSHELQSAVIPAAMKPFRPNHILDLMGIAHEVLRADLRAQNLDEASLCLDPDGHISPGVLHQRKRSLRRLPDVFKQHSLPGKGQKDALFLLDAYQEFLHGLLPKGPFAHIVVQVEYPFILILQYLIEFPGTEQPPRF